MQNLKYHEKNKALRTFKQIRLVKLFPTKEPKYASRVRIIMKNIIIIKI